MKKLLLLVVLSISSNFIFGQIIYEDFQKYYKPNYDTATWEGGPTLEDVNFFQNLTAKAFSDTISKSYYESNEARSHIVNVLLCVSRTKMRDALHLTSAKVAVNLIKRLTDPWQREMMWFLNKKSYNYIAQSLQGIRNFVPEEGEYTLLKNAWTGLSENLNTTYKELNPIISPDGKTLFFSRLNHPLNNYGMYSSQDIWMASMENGIENAKPVHLEYPFNQRINNGVCGFSPDGKTIFIQGRYRDGKRIGPGVSVIKKTKDGYAEPQGFYIEDIGNYDNGKYGGYYMHSDLQTLIFYGTPVDDSPHTNIYVSFRENDTSFSKPISLGPDINHDDSQQSTTYLASDGKTMYFASSHAGYGSSDIWVTKRLDDTWTSWSEPVNLGEKFNSKGFEAYYSIDAKGEYAYMVKETSKENREDIVKIKLDKELQPDPVVMISGKVINAKTEQPVSAEIVYVGLDDGQEYGSTFSDPDDGSYLIILPYGKKYAFNAKADNFVAVTDNVDLTEVGEFDIIERELSLVPIEVGQKVRMNNIFFDLNKSSLQTTSYIELKKVAELLKKNTGMKIEVSGHTDNTGKAAYNMSLSEKRAKAVYDYLLKQGVSSSQLEYKGMGITAPVASNDSEEGRAKNRRVEFEILKVN